tara:strand:- start:21320 stop:21430 length:111 start_codon:yes stop_codon:yes gene_type:complete
MSGDHIIKNEKVRSNLQWVAIALGLLGVVVAAFSFS